MASSPRPLISISTLIPFDWSEALSPPQKAFIFMCRGTNCLVGGSVRQEPLASAPLDRWMHSLKWNPVITWSTGSMASRNTLDSSCVGRAMTRKNF